MHPGDEAQFYPENGNPPIAVTVASIGLAPVRIFDRLDLASVYGGGVAVRKDPAGKLVPETAIYPAILTPHQQGRITTRLRGAVVISGDRASFLSRIYHRTSALVIRESGL
ncbi:MAG: hypothetical protein JWM91_500 [Rhodospirillales bacterium]|nr:hypothetical protein [Rhodospirillales bacterium]